MPGYFLLDSPANKLPIVGRRTRLRLDDPWPAPLLANQPGGDLTGLIVALRTGGERSRVIIADGLLLQQIREDAANILGCCANGSGNWRVDNHSFAAEALGLSRSGVAWWIAAKAWAESCRAAGGILLDSDDTQLERYREAEAMVRCGWMPPSEATP